MALAKIYFNFSDATDDKYYQKYNDYMLKYKDAWGLASLALDENDNGVSDPSEVNKSNFTEIRIRR